MNLQLQTTTEWLLEASSELRSEYFQLPVVGKEEPAYRERVYCYELYHRWRMKWSDQFPYSLSGEVDKSSHPLIRGKSKPDFLVHVPGQMKNLLVMEVKPGNADLNKIVDDLKKLTQYRRNLTQDPDSELNYKAAYLWVYGLTLDEWTLDLRHRLRNKINDRADVDLTLISCFVHESSGVRAKSVGWG